MTARKITAPQKRALMGLRDVYRREGLFYRESYLWAFTTDARGKTLSKGYVAPAMVRALAKAGALELRDRASGHGDGRRVYELRFTAHGVDIINGRAG